MMNVERERELRAGALKAANELMLATDPGIVALRAYARAAAAVCAAREQPASEPEADSFDSLLEEGRKHIADREARIANLTANPGLATCHDVAMLCARLNGLHDYLNRLYRSGYEREVGKALASEPDAAIRAALQAAADELEQSTDSSLAIVTRHFAGALHAARVLPGLLRAEAQAAAMLRVIVRAQAFAGLTADRDPIARKVYDECDATFRDSLTAGRDLLARLQAAEAEVKRLNECLDTWDVCSAGTETELTRLRARRKGVGE